MGSPPFGVFASLSRAGRLENLLFDKREELSQASAKQEDREPK